MSSAWSHPALVTRPLPGGTHLAVYATAPFAEGDLLSVWGGRVLESAAFDALDDALRRHSVQVEDDLYLVPEGVGDVADYFNHACDPNAALEGPITLRARRAIAVGEQVCYDYATTDGSPYDEFDCACGAPDCRGRITGGDWRLSEVQRRYAGVFSPYLARRIRAAGG